MRLTERLNAEHGVFLDLLDQVEHLLRAHASPVVVDAVARSAANVMAPHCRTEDSLLYPALAAAMGKDAPALKSLDSEHDEVERLMREVSLGPYDEKVVRAFVDTTRTHIEREINLFFPLAEEALSEETLASMCDWYSDHVRDKAARSRRPVPASA